MVKSLRRVWLFTTPWTAAYQAPLPMGFSRQEYWNGLPLPSPFITYYYLAKQDPIFKANFTYIFSFLLGRNLGVELVGHDWATSLSRIGEGNGNPLQCSCLENPRDGGAWWAAVYGVAQSQTQLKRLSSSSMLTLCLPFWESMFSKAGTLFHIPTSSMGGFRFLHILTNTCSNYLTFQFKSS